MSLVSCGLFAKENNSGFKPAASEKREDAINSGSTTVSF